jgi:ribosome-binding factor A
MESRRQQQVAGVIQQEIGDILQKNGRNYYGASFVTISGVKVTPDLLVARIFVSVFVEAERKAVIEALKHNASHIRGQLGNKVKNQLRRVPELEFFLDESLDEVFKIDKLLKDIKANEQPKTDE